MNFTTAQLERLTPLDREQLLEFEDHVRFMSAALKGKKATQEEKTAAMVAWCEEDPDPVSRFMWLGFTPEQADDLRRRVKANVR